MDRIWLASPSPAIRLGTAALEGGWRVNTAAQEWAAGREQGAELWPAIAAELHRALRETRVGRLSAAPLDWRAVELDAGWLVWLSPAAEARAPTPWRSAADTLALVQDLAGVGVFERDLRTQVPRWDENMFRLYGLDPRTDRPSFETAIGLVHPDDRERTVAANARAVREGGRHDLRHRIVWADGSVHDMHTLVDVRHAADGTPLTMIGVVVDDSESAARIRAQRVVNDDLERALRLARVSVWRVDYAAQRVHLNPVGYARAGLAPSVEGVDVRALRAMTHPDDLRALDAADTAAAGTDLVDVEVRFRAANSASYEPVLMRRVVERDARGEVSGMFGITIDQPDRGRERERMRTLMRRFKLVTEAARLGIWSVDAEDHHVEWNAQMFEIYGASRDRCPKTPIDWRDNFVHPDDRDALTAEGRNWSKLTVGGYETEFRIVRPDGSVRWVTSRSRREQQHGRTVLIGIQVDTTELVMQRQRAERALRSNQAKSEFLSRASHELRTPLNAVLGFAQLIEHDGETAPVPLQLERVGHIRSAGEHLLALVDDVLDLASIEAGNLAIALAPVSIDAVLRDTAQWLGSLAQRTGVTIEVQRTGGWVQADARRLRQVVANLLGNAIKFNQAGGTVWLGAHAHEDGEARQWCITVRDNGRGFSPDQQADLFEVFHRLGGQGGEGDREDKTDKGIAGVGLGLGLAIAQQLATLMGGQIEVASVAGQGAEFRIGLRAASVPPAAPAAATSSAVRAALSVIYIEDNPVNVILVESLVALRPGVELRCAVDGLSGVAMAIAYPPQLLLIDMQLPDIDGIEVLRRLRRVPALSGTRMVALSANGLTEDIARASAAGFDDYWTKPIDFKHFLTHLDEMCAEVRA